MRRKAKTAEQQEKGVQKYSQRNTQKKHQIHTAPQHPKRGHAHPRNPQGLSLGDFPQDRKDASSSQLTAYLTLLAPLKAQAASLTPHSSTRREHLLTHSHQMDLHTHHSSKHPLPLSYQKALHIHHQSSSNLHATAATRPATRRRQPPTPKAPHSILSIPSTQMSTFPSHPPPI